jgi:hypothetical protein
MIASRVIIPPSASAPLSEFANMRSSVRYWGSCLGDGLRKLAEAADSHRIAPGWANQQQREATMMLRDALPSFINDAFFQSL